MNSTSQTDLLSECLTAFHGPDLARTASDWVPLRGGRTNQLWRGAFGKVEAVCKCYNGIGSELFPNEPRREAQVLEHLAKTGLAPQLLAASETPPAVLYGFVDGAPWNGDVQKAAEALARLHATPPPSLPQRDHSLLGLRRSADRILRELGRPPDSGPGQIGAALAAPPYTPVLLHGDPVPSNLVEHSDGITFIDWQCPAIGDPVTDIAVFLSPAMQALYGGRALSQTDRSEFLEAYGSPEISLRYQIFIEILHWRIALHCSWRAERGAPDYADAAAQELAYLKTLTR